MGLKSLAWKVSVTFLLSNITEFDEVLVGEGGCIRVISLQITVLRSPILWEHNVLPQEFHLAKLL